MEGTVLMNFYNILVKMYAETSEGIRPNYFYIVFILEDFLKKTVAKMYTIL